MNRILILLALAVGYFAWEKQEERRTRVLLSRSLAQSNPCSGKAQCAIVYVTPWCPSCKALKPKFQKLLEKGGSADPAFGMRVLVGLGRAPSDNANEAADYGSFAAVDEGEAFRNAYRIEAFPTVLLVDQDQRVVARGQGALNQMLTRAYPAIKIPQIPAGLPEGALGFPPE